MRILMMCGKGGVGKSTLAAALGTRAAALGQRTLVFSIDPAGSLSLLYGVPVSAEPTLLAPQLWAVELDALAELDARWGDARGYAESIMRSQGLTQPIGNEVGALPGVHELAALIKLKQHADSGQFDTIIVDNAPTGFSMRMTSMPEIFGWYAKHGMRLYERYGAQLLMMLPMLGANVPMPPAPMIGRALELMEQLKGLPALLADPAITSARLVLTPEALAFAEARDLYAHLSLFGVTADAVTVNRVLGAAITDPFFAGHEAREEALVTAARSDFAPLPVLEVPLTAEPPLGLAALSALGLALWPSGDPAARQSNDAALRVITEPGQVQVDIKLPFVAAKDVDLAKFENELYITVGPHRRNIQLAPETADMQPVKAKFSEGRLLVTLARTP